MPAVSSIHWPQAHEACLAKCNFRSHWLTTVVHELVNKPYITPSSHSGLPGFWFVASDLWNTFPSHSGTAFPAFRASHGFTPSKKASLRITTIQPTFDTSSTWACVPGGEPKGAQAGVCWRAAVLGSWASCICTQASPVAASLGLTEQVRNEHRWWPDFFFPLEDPMAPGVLKMRDSVPLSPSTEKLWNSFPRTTGTIIRAQIQENSFSFRPN